MSNEESSLRRPEDVSQIPPSDIPDGVAQNHVPDAAVPRRHTELAREQSTAEFASRADHWVGSLPRRLREDIHYALSATGFLQNEASDREVFNWRGILARLCPDGKPDVRAYITTFLSLPELKAHLKGIKRLGELYGPEFSRSFFGRRSGSHVEVVESSRQDTHDVIDAHYGGIVPRGSQNSVDQRYADPTIVSVEDRGDIILIEHRNRWGNSSTRYIYRDNNPRFVAEKAAALRVITSREEVATKEKRARLHKKAEVRDNSIDRILGSIRYDGSLTAEQRTRIKDLLAQSNLPPDLLRIISGVNVMKQDQYSMSFSNDGALGLSRRTLDRLVGGDRADLEPTLYHEVMGHGIAYTVGNLDAEKMSRLRNMWLSITDRVDLLSSDTYVRGYLEKSNRHRGHLQNRAGIPAHVDEFWANRMSEWHYKKVHGKPLLHHRSLAYSDRDQKLIDDICTQTYALFNATMTDYRARVAESGPTKRLLKSIQRAFFGKNIYSPVAARLEDLAETEQQQKEMTDIAA